VLDNGAGLSREARASARSVARLLESAWGSATMPEFLASMALLGQDGTVRRRLTGSSATGQAHLKTGALRDVRALAGYVRTAKGERWLMVSLVNHPEAHRARDFHDSLLIWIMNQ
jgi:D-alanyl-D-alanine carboxypeptidase/D-alanyl-D-alanine-endopeptidase (penicillin-binding protein 4)